MTQFALCGTNDNGLVLVNLDTFSEAGSLAVTSDYYYSAGNSSKVIFAGPGGNAYLVDLATLGSTSITGTGGIRCGVAAGNYAWFGTSGGSIVKYNLTTGAIEGTVVSALVTTFQQCAIDAANNRAYFTGKAGFKNGGVVQYNTLTDAEVAYVRTESTFDYSPEGIVVDTANGFVYVTDHFGPVYKLSVSPFAIVGGSLNLGSAAMGAAGIDISNQFAYFVAFGSERVYKVNLATFAYVTFVSLTGVPGASNPFACAIDLSTSYFYVGWLTTPGKVSSINLSSFAYVNTLTFATETYAASLFLYSGSTPSPTISLSVATLTPSCFAGETATATSFTITNTGIGTINYTVTNDGDWLTCSPTSGTAPDTITVTYNTSGKIAGTYTCTILVSDPLAGNDPQQINVTLTVNAPTSIMRMKGLRWFDSGADQGFYLGDR